VQQPVPSPPDPLYVPLKFEWGEAFQFDWSEEALVIGGIWRKKTPLAQHQGQR